MKITQSSRFFILSLAISLVLLLVGGIALHFATKPTFELPHINKPSEPSSHAPAQQSQPTAPLHETPPSLTPHPGPSTNITTQDTTSEPLVYYTHEGFSPSTVSVIAAPSNPSCIFRIVNETDNPLMVRLSPHHPKDDWGVQYPIIPAKDSGLIDPRYRIEKIAFHNFDKPEQEFSVTLDSQCLPQ